MTSSDTRARRFKHMKATLLFAGAMLLALSASARAGLFEDDTPAPPVIQAGSARFETAFSPAEDVSARVAGAILAAHSSVRVAARQFVSKPVSEALLQAVRQGREVKVVLDAGNNNTGYSAGQFLLNMGLSPHVTRGDMGIAGGFILIDDQEIILGNIAGVPDERQEKNTWSQALFIHNAPQQLTAQYLTQWRAIWLKSDVMVRQK